MKKILVLGRKKFGEKNSPVELADGLNRQLKNREVESAFFEDVVVIIGEGIDIRILVGEQWCNLSKFALIVMIGWSHNKLYSDLAHVVAIRAHQLSVKVWNTELIGARSMTKISQMAVAVNLGVSVPKSSFSLSPNHLLSTQDLTFPLIAKDPTASRGRRNYLVEDLVQAKKLLDQGELLIQEFVPSDGSDLRIIIANSKPVFAFRREGLADSHLNNISAGGKATKVKLEELPSDLLTTAETLAKGFRRELCGLDFIFDTTRKDYIFLEANLTPQLTNGVFATEKLVALAQAIDNGREVNL